MKAVWNGHISFGLISIPISVHSMLESSERVSLRLLHRKDHSPIQYKKFCSKEDIEVPNDEMEALPKSVGQARSKSRRPAARTAGAA